MITTKKKKKKEENNLLFTSSPFSRIGVLIRVQNREIVAIQSSLETPVAKTIENAERKEDDNKFKSYRFIYLKKDKDLLLYLGSKYEQIQPMYDIEEANGNNAFRVMLKEFESILVHYFLSDKKTVMILDSLVDLYKDFEECKY